MEFITGVRLVDNLVTLAKELDAATEGLCRVLWRVRLMKCSTYAQAL